MRILVTGAEGFAGLYVARALSAHGHTAIGLTRRERKSTTVTTWHEADLADFDRVNAVIADVRPDAVVHLAAVSFVGHRNAGEIYASNIIGTRNLLEALCSHGFAGKAIIVSSANIYGNRMSGPLHEALQPDPRSDYALSKLACEQLASMYADRVSSLVVRPFNYTGVGQSDQFIVPKIIAHTLARSPKIELGNIHVARDFSDVRFFAEAIARLVAIECLPHTIVNICSGRAVTILELLDLVRHLSGHALEVRTNSDLVRSQEVERLWGDDSLLQSLIGPFVGPTLDETLAWMLREV
jgi:nucleoside-diphosphate-sugar epimerase